MHIVEAGLQGVLILTPQHHVDQRGVFSEVFREDVFTAAAGSVRLVQDNQTQSVRRSTLRGLHCQKPPRAQGKLVRVTQGAILDVAVDIRRGSPTFGRHVTMELSAENRKQLWIPAGFLHGFCTLVDQTDVLYKVTDYYSPEHDTVVIWNDPDLAIAWPEFDGGPILSEKDALAPRLRDIEVAFIYGAE